MLEVIALDELDARGAVLGGADRIELVSDMGKWGITPSVETVRAVRAAVDVPVRVMLREADGFAAGDPQVLRERARALLRAGAEEFVLGFLGPDGAVDLAALEAVLEVLDGRPWTFHKAFDFAADRAEALAAIEGLPGLDAVLSSGGRQGVEEGTRTLLAECAARAGTGPRLIAGGVLRERHVAPLRDGGIDAFHVGTRVRPDGSWDRPVDASAVRHWRDLLADAS